MTCTSTVGYTMEVTEVLYTVHIQLGSVTSDTLDTLSP